MDKPVLKPNKPLSIKQHFFAVLVAGVCVLASSVAWGLDVVPGLKGFGTDTRAAYGAANDPVIFIVTNLTVNNNSIPGEGTRNGIAVKTGSFLEAVNYVPPANTGKVIIFEVSGTIGVANAQTRYSVRTPYTTIAGQTAPSPGIVIKNCNLAVCAGDVLVQHLRFRGSYVLKNGIVLGVGTYAGGAGYYDVQNVVVDHCSASWSGESNILVHEYIGGTTKNITISNCIASEGLRWQNPDFTYNNGKGSQASQNTEQVSYIGNLFVHNWMRNPYIRSKSNVVVNNFIYNPGDMSMSVQGLNHVGLYSFKGNVVKGGPWTNSQWTNEYFLTLANLIYTDTEVYVEDNRCDDKVKGDTAYVQPDASDWSRVNDVLPYLDGPFEDKVKALTAPIWPAGLTALASAEVEAHVITNVGARPADRDSVDSRVVGDITAGSGADNHIYTVSGWPVLANKTRTLILPANPHADDDGDGYTNLEEWLHKLAAEVEGVKVLSPADLNQDGQIDIQDIQLCVNVILETEIDPDMVARADVNKDGSVNMLDLQEVVNAVLN